MYTNIDILKDLLYIFIQWILIVSIAYLVVIIIRFIADYFEEK